MPENNPYSPPTSDVKEPPLELGELSEPQKLPGGRGWGWITEGYGYFKESPGTWVLMVVAFVLITIALSFVPFVSLVTSLLMPIFIGGMMLGCRAIDQGEKIQFSHLFAGFQTNAGKLAGVGGLYLLGSLGIGLAVFAIMMLSGGAVALAAASEGTAFNPMLLGISGLLAMLVAMLLMAPLLMAFWFASPLAVLHGIPATQAMKLSFKGCMKNMWPFTLYGLVTMILGIIAAIPLFLGYLVLSPVLIASMYVSYKDIFLKEAQSSN